MISTQLQKSWLSRLLFAGIAVTRTKDKGDRAANADALRECLAQLRAGGSLFIFPEGTSSLGPRHLPFKAGAAFLILEYLKADGPPLHVVPVGILYECPGAFRAKVEVVAGEQVDIAFPSNLSPLAKLAELKRRLEEGLEKVGVNVAGEDYQQEIQRLACVSTLATPRSYFGSLKALEEEIPGPILAGWAALEPELRQKRLLVHQGVPLVPLGSVFSYLFALALLAPVMAAAIALNFPPFAAGWFAGKKFPDDRNVVSLWKVLVGIPAFLLWIVLVTILCLFQGRPMWLAIYALLTWTGLVLYYRVKKLSVAVGNGLRYPKLRLPLLRFRETVLRNLPPDPYAPK
jgi:hypothetical protein